MAVETVITKKDKRVANRMARKQKRLSARAEAEAAGLLPSPRVQAIIAGAVALGAVGLTAFVVSRRKPKLTTIASLWPSAMMLWGTFKSVTKDARQKVESRLH